MVYKLLLAPLGDQLMDESRDGNKDEDETIIHSVSSNVLIGFLSYFQNVCLLILNSC